MMMNIYSSEDGVFHFEGEEETIAVDEEKVWAIRSRIYLVDFSVSPLLSKRRFSF